MSAIIILLGACLGVAWLTCMVRVLTNPGHYRNGTQLIWVLVLLLSGPVGLVLYLCLAPIREPYFSEPKPDHRGRTEAISDPWSEDRRPDHERF